MAPKQRKPSPYTEERLDAIAWILQRAVQKKGAVNPEVAMAAVNLLPGWSATRDGTSYRFKAPKTFKFRGRELKSIAIDKRGKPIDGPTFWTWYFKVGGHQDAMNLRAVTPPAVIERAQAGPKEREVYARIEAVPAIEEALREMTYPRFQKVKGSIRKAIQDRYARIDKLVTRAEDEAARIGYKDPEKLKARWEALQAKAKYSSDVKPAVWPPKVDVFMGRNDPYAHRRGNRKPDPKALKTGERYLVRPAERMAAESYVTKENRGNPQLDLDSAQRLWAEAKHLADQSRDLFDFGVGHHRHSRETPTPPPGKYRAKTQTFQLLEGPKDDPYTREIGVFTSHMGPVKLKQAIEDAAQGKAEFMRDSFVRKNTDKLAQIVIAKGGPEALESVEALKVSNEGVGSFGGTMRLTFRDGSRFDVENTTKVNYTKYGDPYMQYPTTFHRAKFADGSEFSGPSLENLIKKWSKGKK